MREEEATISIMRIRRCIRVSMMCCSVDANPFSHMNLQNRKYSVEFFKIVQTLLNDLADSPQPIIHSIVSLGLSSITLTLYLMLQS